MEESSLPEKTKKLSLPPLSTFGRQVKIIVESQGLENKEQELVETEAKPTNQSEDKISCLLDKTEEKSFGLNDPSLETND